MQAHPELTHDLTLVRLRTLEEVMARHGYPQELAARATAVFRAARNRVEPWPDVIPALQRLRRRYRLVSVTNGNAEVDKTPLAGLFHLDLTSAQVGAAKPDPAIFHAAARWAGLAPSQILHLGDDPLRDVLAARRAGLRAAWVRRAPAVAWPLAEEPPPRWVLPDLWSLVHA
jgi:putative hydrolase of the HAD superfamily